MIRKNESNIAKASVWRKTSFSLEITSANGGKVTKMYKGRCWRDAMCFHTAQRYYTCIFRYVYLYKRDGFSHRDMGTSIMKINQLNCVPTHRLIVISLGYLYYSVLDFFVSPINITFQLTISITFKNSLLFLFLITMWSESGSGLIWGDLSNPKQKVGSISN